MKIRLNGQITTYKTEFQLMDQWLHLSIIRIDNVNVQCTDSGVYSCDIYGLGFNKRQFQQKARINVNACPGVSSSVSGVSTSVPISSSNDTDAISRAPTSSSYAINASSSGTEASSSVTDYSSSVTASSSSATDASSSATDASSTSSSTSSFTDYSSSDHDAGTTVLLASSSAEKHYFRFSCVMGFSFFVLCLLNS